jgi:hypothetical protein
MKPGNVQHLDEEQLVQAVVDQTDLPDDVQAHLAECSQCLAGKTRFELEMATLSQKAEQFAPKPQRRIILPVPKAKKPFWNLFAWPNLAAAAATVTAVFILVWGTNLVRNLSEPGAENLRAEMVEAEQLMTEVNTLVDNALPSFYLVISGENNADYDDDFYQFLIPTVEDKALSSDQGMKGTPLC